MEYSPRCWCAHLKIPRTSKRAAWKVPSANEKCAISHTVRCSNLELNWRRWWDDRAHRVSESVQSKISTCALENSYDHKTSSMVGATVQGVHVRTWKFRSTKFDVSRTSSNVSCNEFCLSVGRSVRLGCMYGWCMYPIEVWVETRWDPSPQKAYKKLSRSEVGC